MDTQENKDIIIAVRNLCKTYTAAGNNMFQPKQHLFAVDDVSFIIKKGEILGLVGESGCGKSTLGRCILRLIQPSSGEVYFQGNDLVHADNRTMKRFRNKMQLIFQNPYSSFDPKMTMGESFKEIGKIHHIPPQKLKEKVTLLLSQIGLDQTALSRRPGDMSGGQLQRLAIARALLVDPQFIVADEPVSALDVSVQAQIINLLMDLRTKWQLTMLFISHELTVVEHICDRVAVMYLGNIVELAETEELYDNIAHPYTAALMSAIPKDRPDEEKTRIPLTGNIPNAIDRPKGCPFADRCSHCTTICRTKKPPLLEIRREHFVACHHPLVFPSAEVHGLWA